ncbi:MAG: Flp family type IVb pilin [Elusimicrobia bacterium]|nr:Flp family type IVb pilin [Candidatus Liberimonas magnetica]
MLKRFWNDESAQGMVEYILIVALVAAVVVVAFKLFGTKIRDMFSDTTKKLTQE